VTWTKPFHQDSGEIWRLDADAAAGLVPLASPFADPRFLAALERLDRRWSTHTVGALAHDGTRAALTVARKGSKAESIPFGYGGILADRALEEEEVTALLHLAARHLNVRRVRSRYVPLPVRGRPAHAGGRVIASTAVVAVAATTEDLESRLSKPARRKIRQAERAGVVVRASCDPTGFLAVYGYASRRYQTVYPAQLVRLIAASGLGRSYDAMVEDEIVGSAFALIGATEWMYWLGAQTERGRRVVSGYPVIAHLLADAQDAGVQFVNLGASAGLPGAGKFKRRMGGVDLPVIEHAIRLRRGGLNPRMVYRDDSIPGLIRRVRSLRQGLAHRS
jgi:hypothetical protein